MNTTEDLSSFYEFVISGLEREADADARGVMALLQGKSQADLVMARNIASTPIIIFRALKASTSRSPAARIGAMRRVRWSDSASMCRWKTPATASRSRKPNEWRFTAILMRLIVRWRECVLFTAQTAGSLSPRNKNLMSLSGSCKPRQMLCVASDPAGFCSDRSMPHRRAV